MKINYLIVTMLVALTLLVSACAPSATAMPAATMAPATQAPAATATSSGSSMSAADTLAATSSSSSGTSMPANTPTAMSASGPAAVNVGTNSKYSAFLVDGKGMTLYIFTKDSSGTSTCTGNCETNWPPLLTNGTPVAGTGVDSTKFGTTTRADGTMQVTYNGWPLYYFAKDQQPGDTNGDGVGSVWSLVTPAGAKAVAGG